MNRYYTRFIEKWEKSDNLIAIHNNSLSVETIENGIVLPPRRKKDKESKESIWYIYEGGVCDSEFNFIAGQIRKPEDMMANLTCYGSYKVDAEEITYKNEEVIYGGVLSKHFGHFITDGLTRFWFLIENLNKKIVFINYSQNVYDFDELFSLIGIKKDMYEIIRKPTKFRKIIVPEESAHFLSNANVVQKNIYSHIIKSAKKYKNLTYDKVYLTRMNFTNSDVNESYYANYFKTLGFEVISPEQLSLTDQVNVINNAKEIACPIGTLSHLLLFAKPHTKLICLLRNPSEIIYPQLVINKLMDLNAYFIEGTRNVLPIAHAKSVSLYYPTIFFKKYIEDNYSHIDEKKFLISDDERNQLIYNYLCNWAINYREEDANKKIKNVTMADFIYNINYALFEENIDKTKLAKTSRYNKQIVDLKKKIEEYQNSNSWKITSPLRKIRNIWKLKKQ